jgi:hypothetical protein
MVLLVTVREDMLSEGLRVMCGGVGVGWEDGELNFEVELSGASPSAVRDN